MQVKKKKCESIHHRDLYTHEAHSVSISVAWCNSPSMTAPITISVHHIVPHIPLLDSSPKHSGNNTFCPHCTHVAALVVCRVRSSMFGESQCPYTAYTLHVTIMWDRSSAQHSMWFTGSKTSIGVHCTTMPAQSTAIPKHSLSSVAAVFHDVPSRATLMTETRIFATPQKKRWSLQLCTGPKRRQHVEQIQKHPFGWLRCAHPSSRMFRMTTIKPLMLLMISECRMTSSVAKLHRLQWLNHLAWTSFGVLEVAGEIGKPDATRQVGRTLQ